MLKDKRSFNSIDEKTEMQLLQQEEAELAAIKARQDRGHIKAEDDDYTPGMGYYMMDGEYTEDKFW